MATAVKQTLTSVMTGKAIPALAGIPLQNDYSPKPLKQNCLLLLGLRGQFKSSFLCSNPDILVEDWEDGCHSVTTKKQSTKVVPINPSVSDAIDPEWYRLSPWERHVKVRDSLVLAARSGNRPCLTVGIDSVDAMYDCIIRKFCKEKGVESPGDYGASQKGAKGWYACRDMFMQEFDAYRSAGYGVWMAAHLRTRTITRNNEEHQYLEPWVPDSLRGSLFKEVDQILTIEMLNLKEKVPVKMEVAGNAVTMQREQQVTQVRLRTMAQTKNTDIKTRVFIPDKFVLPMDDPYTALQGAYDEEVARVKRARQ